MNAIVQYQPRLPMPPSLPHTMDAGKWRVLCETTFPNAKTPESIAMAVDYCRVRGLDIFKKPVHIVPMWNSSLGREVETIWPGINEIQITAARTGQWAGMDVPVWGPMIERTFTGRRKVKGNWEDARAQVDYPEWCSVTVYRMINGQRCPFTEPVYWLEAYSRAGGANSELPTDMWVKRPHGQLHKVAKAAALRAAFPEEGEYTAEEMEGKEIDEGGIVVPGEPMQSPAKVRVPSPNDEPAEDESRLAFISATDLTIKNWAADKSSFKPDLRAWWNSDEQKKLRRMFDLTQDEVNVFVGMIKAATERPADAPKPSPAVPSPDAPETASTDAADGLADFPDPEKQYPEFVEAVRKHIQSMRDDPSKANDWWIAEIDTLPRGTLYPKDRDDLQKELARLRLR